MSTVPESLPRPLTVAVPAAWLTPLELLALGAIWGASFLFQRVASEPFGVFALVETQRWVQKFADAENQKQAGLLMAFTRQNARNLMREPAVAHTPDMGERIGVNHGHVPQDSFQ